MKYKKLENFIDELNGFLNHNLSAKNIDKNTTVEELLVFNKNLKTEYIPMMREVDYACQKRREHIIKANDAIIEFDKK